MVGVGLASYSHIACRTDTIIALMTKLVNLNVVTFLSLIFYLKAEFVAIFFHTFSLHNFRKYDRKKVEKIDFSKVSIIVRNYVVNYRIFCR